VPTIVMGMPTDRNLKPADIGLKITNTDQLHSVNVPQNPLVNIGNAQHVIPPNVAGSGASRPALDYNEASKSGSNPWVRKSATAAGSASPDNAPRTLLVQFATDLI